MLTLTVQGEALILLAEKGICWPRKRTLFLADLHFGKGDTFRSAGIPVPDAVTNSMLDLITRMIHQHAIERVILLGDFVHSAPKADRSYQAHILQWRQQHPELRLMLVPGNHDRGNRKFFKELDIQVTDPTVEEEPFFYSHYPNIDPPAGRFLLAGHIHPAVRIPEAAGRMTKIPCFHFQKDRVTLPAFGAFTGTKAIDRTVGDRVFIVLETSVLELPNIAGSHSQRH